MRLATTLMLLVVSAFLLANASQHGLHVVERESGVLEEMTELAMKEHFAAGEMFFDRTFLLQQNRLGLKASTSPELPMNCTHQPLVKSLNRNLDANVLTETLTELTGFWNRFYTSAFGVEGSEWIEAWYQTAIDQAVGSSATVELFQHEGWPQPSVIATIPGVGVNKDERVIIGAHLDSVNWQGENQNALRAPGACDDGSGVVTVMEVFRVLLEAGFVGNRTIEFHHYAAEEVGLLGSQDVANSYAANDVAVAGYFNMDMDAYNGTVPEFSLITDWTSRTMNHLVKELIDNYSSIGYNEGLCNYACSDHASWHDVGYKAAFAIENGPYPYAHSAEDQIEFLDIPYIMEYCQVALGFLVEASIFVASA